MKSIFTSLFLCLFATCALASFSSNVQSMKALPILSTQATELNLNTNQITTISYGPWRLHPQRKTNAKVLYRIASSTKPFIATTVIELARAGKLKLTDPIDSYLGYRYLHNIENAHASTIKMLLGMQSGIYNYTDNPAFSAYIEAHPHHRWQPLDALYFARNQRAAFPAGTSSKYSNTNYILLGLIIEKVTGEPLERALNHYIFKPLKLKHTFLEYSRKHHGHIAINYTYNKKSGFKAVTSDDGRGLADGGIISTSQDLAHFIKNLFTNKKFMPNYWLKQMTTFHPMQSVDHVDYGLGLVRFRFNKQVWLGHDGSDTGVQSFMGYNPKTKIIVTLIANSKPPRFPLTKVLPVT